MNESYAVYVRIDELNRIVDVNSSAFIDAKKELCWSKIDEGIGYQFKHAQGNYFPLPITNEYGVCRYAYEPYSDAKWRERTKEEMDADYVPPVPALTDEQWRMQIEAALIELAALGTGGDA